jgi:hypothetical protein
MRHAHRSAHSIGRPDVFASTLNIRSAAFFYQVFSDEIFAGESLVSSDIGFVFYLYHARSLEIFSNALKLLI